MSRRLHIENEIRACKAELLELRTAKRLGVSADQVQLFRDKLSALMDALNADPTYKQYPSVLHRGLEDVVIGLKNLDYSYDDFNTEDQDKAFEISKMMSYVMGFLPLVIRSFQNRRAATAMIVITEAIRTKIKVYVKTHPSATLALLQLLTQIGFIFKDADYSDIPSDVSSTLLTIGRILAGTR